MQHDIDRAKCEEIAKTIIDAGDGCVGCCVTYLLNSSLLVFQNLPVEKGAGIDDWLQFHIESLMEVYVQRTVGIPKTPQNIKGGH